MVKGQILYKNGDEYNGQLQNGKMNGHGVYKFKNGSLYEGDFVDNQFSGRGKLIDKLNDLTIVGEFRNSQPNGYARIVYGDGSQYEGNLQNGLRSGKGTYKYATTQQPQIYIGMFVDDSYEGNGELTFKNKNKYKGEFTSNLFHGQGEYTTSEFVYIGEFKMGRIQGKGTMKYKNGEYYDGKFQLNKKNGDGRYHYNDGSQYIGTWNDDLRHGKGKIKKSNGDYYEAEFQKDQLVGQIISKIGDYDIVAELENNKLNGPIKIVSPTLKIQASYKEGVKNGRVVMQKKNKNGQTVTYRGQFKQGKQNPYSVSYSHRF